MAESCQVRLLADVREYLRVMSESPALCPECGAVVSVYEPPAGLYLGCDEPGCGWMSEPANLSPHAVDLEVVLRDARNDPDE